MVNIVLMSCDRAGKGAVTLWTRTWCVRTHAHMLARMEPEHDAAGSCAHFFPLIMQPIKAAVFLPSQQTSFLIIFSFSYKTDLISIYHNPKPIC